MNMSSRSLKIVEPVTKFKLLGIHIFDDLKWDHRVNTICSIEGRFKIIFSEAVEASCSADKRSLELLCDCHQTSIGIWMPGVTPA